MLAEYFSDIWVAGEVSNLRAYPSGHLYFVLKDKDSQIDAVCFRSSAELLKFRLEDGLEVVAHGRVEVYVPRGKYQLVLDRLEPKGLGALQQAFDQLKEKLRKEGLFAPERKRSLPEFPRVLGIVTSPVGAAIRDMLKTLRIHRARMKVLLYPAQVQGEGAAAQIAEGIRSLSEHPGVDVIIVGRGGGSLEDLWPFNEEVVARAIAASRVPVVSGVGHETDFTIADFVADVRAATPTAAAQLVAHGWSEAEDRLRDAGRTLLENIEQVLLDREQRLAELVRHRAFEVVRSRMADAEHSLGWVLLRSEAALNARLGRGRESLARASERLASLHPTAVLARSQVVLGELMARLRSTVEMDLARTGTRLAQLSGQLDVLSPLGSLARGYSICHRLDGVLVRSVRQVSTGDWVNVRVSDGSIGCEVMGADLETGGV